MAFSSFPDWKKIGWHIGKKLRDILNPAPAEPRETEEQRAARRYKDGLKGFVYFEDFGQLRSWSTQDIDPVQQANTPLLQRAAATIHSQPESTTKVLLCHDYGGGYHDYESVRPVPLETELYSCNYLQYVDVFIYFSHKLACVPPPTWINTMHRNGVKILGTFLVEPQSPEIEQILDQIDGDYVIAKQLADLAQSIGFDGWLLNFEKEFPLFTQNLVEKLTRFVSSLRQLLGPNGLVIWYDALTSDNVVEYQNGLTRMNLDFTKSANALFTNYKWTESNTRETFRCARKHGVQHTDVYFGVDVWAQNTNMPGPPRNTFPPSGGGGTNTGLALETLKREGFSTAIFAPAWTYEHFSTVASPEFNFSGISLAKAVDRSMWEGSSLPDDLGCDCQEGKPHHTGTYKTSSITKHAREFPAGSSNFLETHFRTAFAPIFDGDTHRYSLSCSTLGSQDVLPHLHPMPPFEWEQSRRTKPERVIYGEISAENDVFLKVMTKFIGHSESDISWNRSPRQLAADTSIMTRLRLFNLNMPGDGTLEGVINCERDTASCNVNMGFYTAFQVPNSPSHEYNNHHALFELSQEPTDLLLSLDSKFHGARLVELGVYCTGWIPAVNILPLIKIAAITIKPKAHGKQQTFSIEHINIIKRRPDPDHEMRLTWEWQGSVDKGQDALPWSPTTGPFSHFIIFIDGKKIGTAHCLQFPIRDEDVVSLSAEIRVDGVLFGGGTVSSRPTTFS